jgi:hypothetical protein
VVLLSGSRITPDKQAESLESGADGCLVRPISSRGLLARIQAIVRIIWSERDRDFLIENLEKALADIKTLSGIVPICASCKKNQGSPGILGRGRIVRQKTLNRRIHPRDMP